MKGKAYAAGTILNALALGIGCAFGLDLITEARVRFENESVLIVNGEERDASIVRKIIGKDAFVKVKTEIPERSGLGSSSAFVNAVLCAVKRKAYAHEILRKNAEISSAAGISYTGAFDDAAASLLGGFVVSNNYEKRLERWILESYHAAILLPPFSRKKVDWSKIKENSYKLIDALDALNEGKLFEVMKKNTTFYCEMIGYPIEIAEKLWKEGIFCGLSGNGPSFVALGSRSDVKIAKDLWREYGKVIVKKIPKKPAEDVIIVRDLFLVA